MHTSRPELESQRVLAQLEGLERDAHYRSKTTSIDLLEVYDDPVPRVFYELSMQHNGLVKHVLDADRDQLLPRLRIFFIDGHFDTTYLYADPSIHPKTLAWFHARFNVSPVYLENVAIVRYIGKIGNALFTKRNKDGSIASFTGFYQCSSGINSGVISVWFCHERGSKSSTYVISNCPHKAQHGMVSCTQGPDPLVLIRPLAVDALLLEDCSRDWTDAISRPRLELITYEQRDPAKPLTPDETTRAIASLHSVSQLLNIIHQDIADLEERAAYLLDVHAKLRDTFAIQHTDIGDGVDESIAYTLSRSRICNRWVDNYIERTKIRIDLFFNLATQSDNRTNLDIANLTSEIAVQTQMDSTSMITMATVTMFFLPATFVCAFFSMVFFNSGIDADGRAAFAVSPLWWYFLVVTIPLTIAVFVVWGVWQRMRLSRTGVRDRLSARRTAQGGADPAEKDTRGAQSGLGFRRRAGSRAG